jgi:hypothetical protein
LTHCVEQREVHACLQQSVTQLLTNSGRRDLNERLLMMCTLSMKYGAVYWLTRTQAAAAVNELRDVPTEALSVHHKFLATDRLFERVFNGAVTAFLKRRFAAGEMHFAPFLLPKNAFYSSSGGVVVVNEADFRRLASLPDGVQV